jgi:hypothetical protein
MYGVVESFCMLCSVGVFHLTTRLSPTYSGKSKVRKSTSLSPDCPIEETYFLVSLEVDRKNSAQNDEHFFVIGGVWREAELEVV